MKQFADAHGTPAQRFYNLLCIAYGADAQLFGDMVEEAHLPKERADDCKDEYLQVALAYEKLIGPHIDHVIAKELFDKAGCLTQRYGCRAERRSRNELSQPPYPRVTAYAAVTASEPGSRPRYHRVPQAPDRAIAPSSILNETFNLG